MTLNWNSSFHKRFEGVLLSFNQQRFPDNFLLDCSQLVQQEHTHTAYYKFFLSVTVNQMVTGHMHTKDILKDILKNIFKDILKDNCADHHKMSEANLLLFKCLLQPIVKDLMDLMARPVVTVVDLTH